MIVADFATIPMGTGTSTSHYVLAVHELLRQSGIKFAAGTMSTAIEASTFDELNTYAGRDGCAENNNHGSYRLPSG